MGEDGQFKYRRLPKDSYKQGIITDIRQMGGYPEYKGTPYAMGPVKVTVPFPMMEHLLGSNPILGELKD